MAWRISLGMLAVWAVAALGGCGTLMNTSPEPPGMARPTDGPTQRIYGGVRHDALVGGSLLVEGGKMPPLMFVGLYMLAVDMPLSFIGDTVTLPWMVAATVERCRGPRPDSTPAKNSRPADANDELGLGDVSIQSPTSAKPSRPRLAED
jgi:uncharacterized protein YceK